MAEDRMGSSNHESHTYWAWTELFRTFQVALDPKKLILAAAGIFVMWAGWWLLSIIFYNARAKPSADSRIELRVPGAAPDAAARAWAR